MQITGSILQPALTIKVTSLGAVMQFASIPNASTGSFTGSAGNMWFNTDTNQLQYTYQSGSVATGAPSVWTTGPGLICGRGYLGGTGTQTAALAFGGFNGSGLNTCTELYNGSSWALVGTMNIGRHGMATAGVSTATIAAGGPGTSANWNNTEVYDGTTWINKAALITARAQSAGAGTTTSFLAFGGYAQAAPNPNVSCTELYNGSSWTAGGAMINARSLYGGGTGISTDALAFGGIISAGVSCTETYNGTSWSSATAMITARYSAAKAGTQSSALAAGGAIYPPNSAATCTEIYNGTSWSTTTSIITARCLFSGAGTSTAAAAFGGYSTCTCTELFTAPTRPLICTRSL